MLYTLAVYVAESEPHPWDSLDGVSTYKCQTPNVAPLGEKTTPEEAQAALVERHYIGRVPASEEPVPPHVRRDYIHLASDGTGLVYATWAAGDTFVSNDRTQWRVLSARCWQAVGMYFVRVELLREPSGSWTDKLSSRSRWRRFTDWLFSRRCGRCLYFDRKGAHQWRTKVTHAFGGVAGGADGALHEAMNDDITKIAAAEIQAPDFQNNEMGYCPRRDCGLSARLRACSEYKRA